MIKILIDVPERQCIICPYFNNYLYLSHARIILCSIYSIISYAVSKVFIIFGFLTQDDSWAEWAQIVRGHRIIQEIRKVIYEEAKTQYDNFVAKKTRSSLGPMQYKPPLLDTATLSTIDVPGLSGIYIDSPFNIPDPNEINTAPARIEYVNNEFRVNP